MIDVTTLFEDAVKCASFWNERDVTRFLQEVRDKILSAQIDWEPGDEDWGRIVVGKQIAMIVHTKFPFAIVVKSFENAAKSTINASNVISVTVVDFEAQCLSVDKSKLETILSRSLSDAVNYAQISAHDLWWATV